MKLSILQESLAKGLSIVTRATANRSTLPVLGNVLLVADEDGLSLSATNLEIGLTCRVAARTDVHGAVTVPARLLSDFVNSLPPERIDLKLDEPTQTLNLKCASFKSNIKGISAEEFPQVPAVEMLTSSDAAPGMFKIPGDETFSCVLMPMQVNR